jgi:hypothetical protein
LLEILGESISFLFGIEWQKRMDASSWRRVGLKGKGNVRKDRLPTQKSFLINLPAVKITEING